MSLLHIVLALGAIGAEPVPAPGAISYRVTPQIEAGSLRTLSVEASFRADASGRTILELPDHGSGDKDWWRLLSDLQVENATVQVTSPAERVLTSAPSATIVVRYQVRTGYDRDPTVADGNPFRPIIRPTWFQVLGERVFVAPKGRDKARVSFSWGPLPSGWQVASDLEHKTPQTAATAQNSILVGGADVRVVERRTAGGGLLRVASRGAWTFEPAALAEKVAQVGDTEDRFWGEGGKPFLVSLIPLAPLGTAHSSGGRGLSEAFALYEEPSAKLDDFTFLLAHERMHTWISQGLGGLPDDNEALDYWLSEGFTDFYAARLLLRSGTWSLEAFAAQENEMLIRYWGSGVRNAPNARIQQAFWTDNAVEQLPYDRGRLFATILDRRLRRASRARLNLDSVMRRQRKLALRNEGAGVTTTAAPLFGAVYRQVSGIDISPDLARYIQAGATIRLPADLYGDCATVTTLSIPDFDRGFDGEKSKASGVIVGVDPNGPAYAAGLRNGMKRLGREGARDGNSQLVIGYRVADDDGKEQVVLYHPAGKAKVTIQQVEIRPRMSPAMRSACVRSMSGGA